MHEVISMKPYDEESAEFLKPLYDENNEVIIKVNSILEIKSTPCYIFNGIYFSGIALSHAMYS